MWMLVLLIVNMTSIQFSLEHTSCTNQSTAMPVKYTCLVSPGELGDTAAPSGPVSCAKLLDLVLACLGHNLKWMTIEPATAERRHVNDLGSIYQQDLAVSIDKPVFTL